MGQEQVTGILLIHLSFIYASFMKHHVPSINFYTHPFSVGNAFS